jgi:hypothetical protein
MPRVVFSLRHTGTPTGQPRRGYKRPPQPGRCRVASLAVRLTLSWRQLMCAKLTSGMSPGAGAELRGLELG